jgi:hypothetical protein
MESDWYFEYPKKKLLNVYFSHGQGLFSLLMQLSFHLADFSKTQPWFQKAIDFAFLLA